ncbi:sugar phosphate isomerase/epimerase [Candidatus Woesearchaeota archaeon]|nr:sugar phosphate isomerase/epimerase [Candidatus Woesearchaeota archaeon]
MDSSYCIQNRKLPNALETIIYSQDNTINFVKYNFSVDGNNSDIAVIFNGKGNVIYPIATNPSLRRKSKVLANRRIGLDLDYYKTFNDLKGESVHLLLPRERELYQIEHKVLRKYFKEDGIDVRLVHAPYIDVQKDEFLGVIAYIRGNYGVDTITLHPAKGTVSVINEYFEKNKVFPCLGVRLAFENLDVTDDRWLNYPEQIMDISSPQVGLTLDVSHLNQDSDLFDLVERIFQKLFVVQISNKSGNRKDLPYREGEMNVQGLLSVLKSNGYNGDLVLEYAPEFKEQEIDDLKRLQDFFS